MDIPQGGTVLLWQIECTQDKLAIAHDVRDVIAVFQGTERVEAGIGCLAIAAVPLEDAMCEVGKLLKVAELQVANVVPLLLLATFRKTLT